MVSDIEIGLYFSEFGFGMKIALNLYRFGRYRQLSGQSIKSLNKFTIYCKNSFYSFAMYFRCIGPNPDGPQALCFLSCLIALLTSAIVILLNYSFEMIYSCGTICNCFGAGYKSANNCFYTSIDGCGGGT